MEKLASTLASAAPKQTGSLIERLSPAWIEQRKAPLPPPTASMGARVRPRIAVYLRYSTDQQDPYSFERQLAKARDYAASIEGDIVKVYGDPAESGAYTANRPGFKDMLSGARRREFDIVLIEHGDRLSRRLHITTSTFAELAECRVELHSSQVGKWTLMHAAFTGLLSEEQRTRLTELMRSGIVKIVNKGLWPGMAPYGFEKVLGSPGEMRHVPAEAEIIRRMFRQRRAGLSPETIAELLNADKIKAPIRQYWSGAAVRFMLTNPIYVGVIIFFKTRQTKREENDRIKSISEKRAISEWKYSERPDWAIITDHDEWREVQALMAPKRPMYGPRPKYLLSRIAVCGACGGAMAVNANPKYSPVMRCTTNKRIKYRWTEDAPCNQCQVRLESLDDAVFALLCEKLDNPDALKNMQKGYESKIREESETLNAQRNRLEKERDAVNNRLDATYDAALVAGLTTKIVAEQRQKLCARIDEIDTALASIPAIAIAPESFKNAPVDVSSFLNALIPGRNYSGCDEATAYLMETTRRLIGRVLVSSDPTSKIVKIKLEGPIADVDGSAEREFAPASHVPAHVRVANRKARAGTFSIADSDWEKICGKLPSAPIWIEDLDEPLSFRRVLDAVIFLKHTRIGAPNLPKDIFGPRKHVWAAARMLNYAGILKVAQEVMSQESIQLVDGINLAIDSHYSKVKDPIQRYVEWNNRRRSLVLARLERAKRDGDPSCGLSDLQSSG